MRSLARPFCVAAAPFLGSCAAQFMHSAQNECSSFGYTAGTSEYAACVQQQYDSDRARFQQGLANASRAMNQQSYTPTYGGVASGTAFLRNSYVSGMNRVCVYDRLGSAYVTTIGAAEICPLSVP